MAKQNQERGARIAALAMGVITVAGMMLTGQARADGYHWEEAGWKFEYMDGSVCVHHHDGSQHEAHTRGSYRPCADLATAPEKEGAWCHDVAQNFIAAHTAKGAPAMPGGCSATNVKSAYRIYRSAQTTATRSPDSVSIFEHVRFGGRQLQLKANAASSVLEHLEGLQPASWNDMISSLIIPPGYRVVLHEDVRQGGRRKVIENYNACPLRVTSLSDFDDMTSSMTIEKMEFSRAPADYRHQCELGL